MAYPGIEQGLRGSQTGLTARAQRVNYCACEENFYPIRSKAGATDAALFIQDRPQNRDDEMCEMGSAFV